MSCNKIITITRQYGSGGHDIGSLLASKLDIPFYDKELITIAAKERGVAPEIFEQVDEKPTNSLLYALSLGLYDYGNGFNTTMGNMPINDELYILQHKIIKEMAQMQNFVVVGRCADYVLRDNPNVVKVFIYADIDSRIKRVLARHDDIDPAKAKQAVLKVDKVRSNYYGFYSGQKWGQPENYDLCINSSHLTMEQAVDVIMDSIDVFDKK